MTATQTVFNGEPLTRREVEIAREAFVKACEYFALGNDKQRYRIAEQMFPAPKVTRPRVVADPHDVSTQWRWISDRLEFRCGGEWYSMLQKGYGSDFKPTAKRIALWADLLANPLEEIEDIGE